MNTRIDHLVIAAQTLEQGVAWCEATLGLTPAPGGEHPQFGTHNRLFKLATPRHPLAYCEIIAVEPGAKGPAQVNAKRWFDLDDPALQAAIAKNPRLVHFVASTDDITVARTALSKLDIDRGPALPASRHSRKGVLRWRITVRNDGQRLFDGALPSLIQWGQPEDADPLRLHPRNSLPRSGVSLQGLAISHPTAPKLQAAFEAMGLSGIPIETGPANLTATLKTPKGPVVLQSHGV